MRKKEVESQDGIKDEIRQVTYIGIKKGKKCGVVGVVQKLTYMHFCV
jgi:hypothetical protein